MLRPSLPSWCDAGGIGANPVILEHGCDSKARGGDQRDLDRDAFARVNEDADCRFDSIDAMVVAAELRHAAATWAAMPN
jgi:hypothetical protein